MDLVVTAVGDYYRPISEHSVPMVTHSIGDRVLTIEVATHADVCDNFWKSPTRSSIRKLFTELLTEFCTCPLTSNRNAQSGVYCTAC